MSMAVESNLTKEGIRMLNKNELQIFKLLKKNKCYPKRMAV
jgi:hypothetical protein